MTCDSLILAILVPANAAVVARIDAVHLLYPAETLVMRQSQNLIMTPTQAYCDECYLLVQAFEGVAYDSPNSGTSTSNSCPQLGQTVVSVWVSTSLICRYRS